jgi:hypothetical protein
LKVDILACEIGTQQYSAWAVDTQGDVIVVITVCLELFGTAD